MTDANVVFHVEPGGSLRGTVQVPGDKSISHRALMLAAIADGDSRLSGFLPGEDTLATQRALASMAVVFEPVSATELVVKGVGMHGLKNPGTPLDLGNSGTSTRLLAGLLAGAGVDCEIIGDASLMRRPMGRVIEPLHEMGADIHGSEAQTLPLRIRPSARLSGIRYRMPVASAQLKSCLLLAGLYADGNTCVQQPAPSRDHTERMLVAFGADVHINNDEICIEPADRLRATDVSVPADISSAAFFMVGALIAPGSDILLPGVGINPTRSAVIDILRKMGGRISLSNERSEGGEPVADIRVVTSELHGIDIPRHLVPIAIDEFPAILVAAGVADGITRLGGAEELRVKESDRIAAMSAGLDRLGIEVEPRADGMQVQGGVFSGGRINSHGDHRIAMAFAMAGLAAKGRIQIVDCANVATSFPGFMEIARQAGLQISAERS